MYRTQRISKFFSLLALFGCFSLLMPTQARGEVSDPLESFNRSIFWFNDKLDIYLLEPVAKGYDRYMPKPFQKGIHNFFQNIKTPVYVVSDVTQLKFAQAGNHFGRFLINTTIGGLGIADAATTFNMPEHVEDFGTALGYHGVPEGPYIVLPVLGPSNCRDAFGRLVDSFLSPTQYTGVVWEDGQEISIGLTVVEGIDTRARLLDAVESAKETSLDYYSFVKNSYHQLRQNLIYDDFPPEELDDAESLESSK